MKDFNLRKNETGDQFSERISRYTTDKIIEDIEVISLFSDERIKTILEQLSPEALSLIIEDCTKLEKFNVCSIAKDLIIEKNAQ